MKKDDSTIPDRPLNRSRENTLPGGIAVSPLPAINEACTPSLTTQTIGTSAEVAAADGAPNGGGRAASPAAPKRKKSMWEFGFHSISMEQARQNAMVKPRRLRDDELFTSRKWDKANQPAPPKNRVEAWKAAALVWARGFWTWWRRPWHIKQRRLQIVIGVFAAMALLVGYAAMRTRSSTGRVREGHLQAAQTDTMQDVSTILPPAAPARASDVATRAPAPRAPLPSVALGGSDAVASEPQQGKRLLNGSSPASTQRRARAGSMSAASLARPLVPPAPNRSAVPSPVDPPPAASATPATQSPEPASSSPPPKKFLIRTQ